MIKAILIEKDDAGYRSTLKAIDESMLPEGEVSVELLYSSLNYKDALAITGKGPVVRNFPLVPGIDLAGRVLESANPQIKPGSLVMATGWGLGELYWGGLAERAKLRAEWLLPVPEKLTPQQTMVIGTAGFTAMLCVLALEEHGVTPEKGEVLVTGASGGVGSIAVMILAKLGYTVAALSRPERGDYLMQLGASEVLPREILSEPGKPLGRERWAGVVDTVGSHTLANACATTQRDGVVAACGLAGGMDFPSTVAPFILRGVTLAGIDSVMCSTERRRLAWDRLQHDIDLEMLVAATQEVGLSEAIETAGKLLAGEIRGRVVVDVKR